MIRKLSIVALLLMAGCAKYHPMDYSTFSCSEMDDEIVAVSKQIDKRNNRKAVKNISEIGLVAAPITGGVSWWVAVIGVPVVETAYEFLWGTKADALEKDRDLLRNMKGVHCYVGPDNGE